MARFAHVQLRTESVDDAREFYGAVLGDVPLDVVELNAQARARGARPHWLGYLEVPSVEDAAEAFVERGATRLGPTSVSPDGASVAMLRDPGSAVVALASNLAQGASPPVASYVLNGIGAERAMATYGALFGWAFDRPVELGEHGVFHPFAWDRRGARVGFVGDILGRRGVHAHWLFHFAVPALDEATAAVRAAGGYVASRLVAPGGARVAVCDESQGAAFGMIEEAPAG